MTVARAAAPEEDGRPVGPFDVTAEEMQVGCGVHYCVWSTVYVCGSVTLRMTKPCVVLCGAVAVQEIIRIGAELDAKDPRFRVPMY